MNEPVKTLPHFSLVTAEVVFSDPKNSLGMRRVQFFSKADTDRFPARRLGHLQNTAAAQIKNEMKDVEDLTILEVTFLGLHPLGWMTDEEFWEGTAKETPSVDETKPGVTTEAPKVVADPS